ncbi:hypothetical protein SORBI_3010G087050 [Sorghum bicolor]|uniref:Uncharacterized protein n=1 Tax=Sorghum bicolor TaxID=4558 RepID=A0A1W0VS27_SORBI|nr:hypothetical protein SORBI_3010G087050 [Sorghum bicolor]
MMQATRSSACGSQLPRTLCAIPCKQIAQFSAPAAGAAIDMDEAQPLFDEMPPRLQGSNSGTAAQAQFPPLRTFPVLQNYQLMKEVMVEKHELANSLQCRRLPWDP